MNKLPIINLGHKSAYKNSISWNEAKTYCEIFDYNKKFNEQVTSNPLSILKAEVNLKGQKNELLSKILNAFKNGETKYIIAINQLQLLTNSTMRECMNLLKLVK